MDFFDVKPDDLPESYEARMTDAEALRQVRDSATGQTLKALPSVQDLIFRCITIDECRRQHTPQPTPRPS